MARRRLRLLMGGDQLISHHVKWELVWSGDSGCFVKLCVSALLCISHAASRRKRCYKSSIEVLQHSRLADCIE